MKKIVDMLTWAQSACLYWMHRNKKRDNHLWVFGCWGGVKYADNAKYLFEYVNKNYPSIRAVWITAKSDIKDRLTNAGYEAYLSDTELAENVLSQAGVAFFTNSLNDFGMHPFLNGAKLCALFHGVGFKNELRELDDQNTLKAKFKGLKHAIYDLSYTDYIFTTSEFFKKKFYNQQYNAKLNSIAVTGQPRNDALFENGQPYPAEKTILYLPTFRENKDGQIRLEKIINELLGFTKLNDLLKKYDYTLLIKPHYLTKIHKAKWFSNIQILNDTDVTDIQTLLARVGMLITDYSSVIGDFALLDRPIIFYSYDLEEYCANNHMHPAYMEVLSDTYVKNNEELYSVLEMLFQGSIDYHRTVDAVNSYINAKSLRNGGYCSNVCQYLIGKLGL